MVQEPRTRLEQTAHLSVREFVGRFHAAAIECGEEKAHISERQAKRWLAGESDLPRPMCCRVLEHWWAESVSRLLGPPDSGRVAVFVSEEELIVNAGRESVDHAIKAALALFGEMPEGIRSGAGELGARVDLAAARTLRGDLAGAEDALVAVFVLDPERRTETVVRRLTKLGRVLGSARYRGAVEAGRIGDAIEDFTARSLPRSATWAIIDSAG